MKREPTQRGPNLSIATMLTRTSPTRLSTGSAARIRSTYHAVQRLRTVELDRRWITMKREALHHRRPADWRRSSEWIRSAELRRWLVLGEISGSGLPTRAEQVCRALTLSIAARRAPLPRWHGSLIFEQRQGASQVPYRCTQDNLTYVRGPYPASDPPRIAREAALRHQAPMGATAACVCLTVVAATPPTTSCSRSKDAQPDGPHHRSRCWRFDDDSQSARTGPSAAPAHLAPDTQDGA